MFINDHHNIYICYLHFKLFYFILFYLFFISVEFCIHITVAFMRAPGSRDYRVAAAMIGVGSSVVRLIHNNIYMYKFPYLFSIYICVCVVVCMSMYLYLFCMYVHVPIYIYILFHTYLNQKTKKKKNPKKFDPFLSNYRTL